MAQRACAVMTRLMRVGPSGTERPAVRLNDGRTVDASAVVSGCTGSFLESGGVARLREVAYPANAGGVSPGHEQWVKSGEAARAPSLAEPYRTGPPITMPSKIVCVALNFKDHARESGMQLPKEPLIFTKYTNSFTGPFDDLIIPRGSSKTDYEVELGVVIGKRASYVPEVDAMDYIGGYVLANDVSEREWQLERGGQFVKGKSFDTFCPVGPWFVPAEELDPSALNMELDVNGQAKQRGNTADMVFGVAFILSHVSHFTTLLPGDLILTGTPAGVGLGRKPPEYLQVGDVVSYGIEGASSLPSE